jgi:holo-[acyl-carrier protein] synthase
MKNVNSPILGLGNDIIEIERIRKSIESHGIRLINRLFSQKEQDYCFKHADPTPHFAGRFSAKEAIVKALGSGFGEHASWLDMEVLNDEKGKPYVIFSQKVMKHFHDPHLLISISHCELYATATAIWVNTSQS